MLKTFTRPAMIFIPFLLGALFPQVHVLNDIYRFSGLIVIFFRDKNDIGIRQFSVILILVQIFYLDVLS